MTLRFAPLLLVLLLLPSLLAGCADAGGARFGVSSTELVVGVDRDPVALVRTFERAVFDDELGNGDRITDSWRLVPFHLTQPVEVEVRILSLGGKPRGELVRRRRLGQGDHVFVLSYGQVRGKLGREKDFKVVIAARSAKGPTDQRVVLDGFLEENAGGDLLQRVMEDDVSIFDGTLHWQTTDLNVWGRGPQLDFVRYYSNVEDRSEDHSALGPGWGYNHDIRLRVVAHGERATPFNLPQWVVAARGRFLSLKDVPESDGRPRYVSVAGNAQFKRVGERWLPSRGYHGSLRETRKGFVFESLDGHQYFFERPRRSKNALASPGRAPRAEWLRGRHRLGPAMDAPLRVLKDRWGNAFTYDYAATREGPYLVRAVDAAGRAFDFTYDPAIGGPEEVEGVMGAHGRAQFAHAPRRLIRVEGPGGIRLEYHYDRETRLLASVEIGHFRQSYLYEPERGPSGAPPVGSLRATQYNLAAIVDGNGHATEFEYARPESLPRRMRRLIPGMNPADVVSGIRYADGHSARFEYEPDGGGTRRKIDPRGFATLYRLNDTGNPLEIREPLGKFTRMRWTIDQGEPDLLMTSITRSGEGTTYLRYDDGGNEIDRIDAQGVRTRTSWTDRFHLQASREVSSGGSTRNRYDEQGNLIEQVVKDEEGTQRSRYEYNRYGELVAASLETGGMVRHEYDDIGQRVRTSYPDGRVVQFSYDARGRIIKRNDGSGYVSTWEYDTMDNVTKEFDPEEGWTSSEYDAANNEVKRTVDGNEFYLEYDQRNRLVFIGGEGFGKRWAYDANGNLILETDSEGNVVRHHYDALNREQEPVPADSEASSV